MSQQLCQPQYLELPSPFHVLTEQKLVKCTNKKTLEIRVDIFVVPKLKSAEVMKKELTDKECKTITSICKRNSEGRYKETYKESTMNIYYSPKGICISMVQKFNHFQYNLDSLVPKFPPMETTWPTMIPVKLTTSNGKKIRGTLRMDTLLEEQQEEEHVKFGWSVNIGLKDVTNIETASTTIQKNASDKLNLTKLDMSVQFDEKKKSLLIAHTAEAKCSASANRRTGSVTIYRKIESALEY